MPTPQFNIQAQLDAVRQRVQSARPNLIPQFTAGMGRASGGRLIQNAVNRARSMAGSRPFISQLMQGAARNGGAVAKAAAVQQMNAAGFRAEEPVTTPVVGGYKFTE